MAFNLGRRLEGTAYCVINEVLSGFHSDDGYARANRYEVMLNAPTGEKGTTPTNLQNIFSKVMGQAKGDGTVRKTGLRCESISFPGRNLDTTPDTNIYGPTREIVNVLRGLAGVNLISADVVEVSPAYDHAELTSLAAATIIYELTNLFAKS